MKQNYSKKKLFWDIICNLLRAGFTELVAIGKIRQVYGMNYSVMYIVNKMRVDTKTEGIQTCALRYHNCFILR